MSFSVQKELVEDGDTIMLYLGKNSLTSILIDVSKTHQTKFGAFPHKEFIGKKFGTKMYSKNRRGWVYILHPTPELWTVTLPHRTQILYSTDISLITMELELKPGSVVVESGTGSGSLSHAIIRTVKPHGHLYTYDFHEQRVQKAREEFNAHGIGEFVTCNHADACKDGFTVEDKADAVFLDLPAPWEAIPHAKKALKTSGGRICSFSPCIEQVQRTCDALRRSRFFEIKTVECLLRSLNVRTVPFPEANLGSTEISLNAKPDEGKQDKDSSEPEVKKIKTETTVEGEVSIKNNEIQELMSSGEVLKKPVNDTSKTNCNMPEDTLKCIDEIKSDVHDNSNTELKSTDSVNKSIDNNENTTKGQANFNYKNDISGTDSRGMVTKFIANTKKGNINVLTCKSNKDMPGHTGYLTFASLYPNWNSSSEE